MLVVGDCDNDGIDILAVEDGAIVAGCRNAAVVESFLRGDVAAVIKVADRHALHAGDLKRGLQQFASANAGANAGETHGVAGRYWTRRG